jgi:hypothetical protein
MKSRICELESWQLLVCPERRQRQESNVPATKTVEKFERKLIAERSILSASSPGGFDQTPFHVQT